MSELDQGDSGASLEKELSSLSLKKCLKCKKSFKPAIDTQQVCHNCSQISNISTPKADDRKRGASCSPEMAEEAKRNKMDEQDDEVKKDPLQEIDLGNLEKLNQNSLAQIVRSLAKSYEKQKEYIKKLENGNFALQQELNNVKIAFADKAYKILASGSKLSYASAVKGCQQDESGKAVLVAESVLSTSVDINQVDLLLGSRSNGPVAQAVRQKEKKVILTFSNNKEMNAAKTIIESSTEGKKIFKSVTSSIKYYPVLAKYANLEHDEETIKSELRYRNPVLRDHLASIKVVFRSSDPNIGHIKIWLTSAAVRDVIIKRGELFLPGRRCRAVLPDLNFEVKRCYKCQQYGHLIKDCKEPTDICGKCAGQHKTSLCVVKEQKKFKCSNCLKMKHRNSTTSTEHVAGDKNCPVQMRALSRYKTSYGL